MTAEQYLATLPGSEQAQVRASLEASGNTLDQWFQNAINAGDPRAVRAAGGGEGAGWGQGQAEEGSGGIADWRGAAPSSEWLGKRAPTPRELRRYARDQGWSEDFQRYDDRQLADWLRRGQWDVASGRFAGGVEKPTETGGALAPRGGGGGGYGGGQDMGGYMTNAGGGGGGGGGRGGYGGSPQFEYGEFQAPTWEQAMQDPGYQAALEEGARQLQQSQAAQGLMRTGGSLKDLINYGQNAATQQYQNVWDREAQKYGLGRETAQMRFQPKYNAWETVYGGNLQKYLQREQNIYGLLNPTMPSF